MSEFDLLTGKAKEIYERHNWLDESYFSFVKRCTQVPSAELIELRETVNEQTAELARLRAENERLKEVVKFLDDGTLPSWAPEMKPVSIAELMRRTATPEQENQ